jgi:hypothetical protein
MTRASNLHLAIASCLLPLLALPAFAQDDDEEAFDRTPRDCILATSIDETDAIDDQNILFYMRDRGVYRNHLPRKCPGLERENRMSYKLHGTRRLCSSDTITVLEESGFGVGGGLGAFRDGFTCRLGEFVPLSPEEVEELDLREDKGRGGRQRKNTIETREVELPNPEPASEGEQPAAAEPDSAPGERD